MKSQFLRGTAWMSISNLIFLAIGYIAQILIGRSLTPTEYGTFGVAVYILNIVEFVVITGLSQSLSKFIAEQPQAGRNLIRHSSIAQLLLFVVVAMPLWVFAPNIARWFGDEAMTSLLRVVAIILPFYSARGLLQGILSGQREFSSVAKVKIVIAVVKFLLIVIALVLHAQPSTILVAYLLSSFAGALYGWHYVRPIEHTEKIPARRFYGYALSLTIYLIIFPLFINLDVFLVKHLLGTDPRVGWYVASTTLARMPFYLFTGLLLTLLPTVAYLKQSAFPELQRIVREVNRYALLLLLPLVVLVGLTAGALLPLLFGQAYAGASSSLIILLGSVGMLVFFQIYTTILVGLSNPARVAWITIGMIALNLALNLLLIPRFGILGAASSSTLSSALGLLVSILFIHRERVLLIDWRSARNALLAAILSGLTVVFHIHSLWLFAQLLGGGLVYLAFLWLFREILPKDLNRLRALVGRSKATEVPPSETSTGE